MPSTFATRLAAAGLLLLSLTACQRVREVAGRPAELAKAQWDRLQARWSAVARGDEEATTDERAPAPVVAAEPEPPPTPQRLPQEALTPDLLAARLAEYHEPRAKGVLEIQPWRSISAIDAIGSNGDTGRAVLVNVNPTINSWYVLTLDWGGGRAPVTYHLVNEGPRVRDLVLDPEFPYGIVLRDTLESRPCALWSADAPLRLADASASQTLYVSLCGQQVTLRLPTEGRKTGLEKVTDFLRDNVWYGEAITVFVRQTFFRDAFLESGELVEADVPDRISPTGPPPARLEPGSGDQLLTASGLGLELETTTPGAIGVGRWYAKRGAEGVFVSGLKPGLVDPTILTSHRDRVAALDEVERGAIAYLVAFDLSRFEIGFMVGTDHPRLGWSDRIPAAVRDPRFPGPDGLDTMKPLVPTGVLGPGAAARVVATFTGGFKRSHGAFRTGALSMRNGGSHYGFIESGAILSKLQPGLATFYVLDDGSVGAKTWEPDDDVLLPRLAFARQNGVPLLEPDPETGEIVPGRLVTRWAEGNWSGSHDGKLRSLRAGVCLTHNDGAEFLVYGYFSTATPSAMVRVFQAYGCTYAMLTDMNALEHTYLAIYTPDSGSMVVEHLIDEMSVLDQLKDDVLRPRFLGFADNRDFFYVLRKEEE